VPKKAFGEVFFGWRSEAKRHPAGGTYRTMKCGVRIKSGKRKIEEEDENEDEEDSKANMEGGFFN